MILAAVIIWVLTLLTLYLNRSLPRKLCPVCVGVSGTWILLSAGVIWGFFSTDYKTPIAMLMGGTVVGIAFQGEKQWPWARSSILHWKVPVIVIGMPVAYFLFNKMSLSVLLLEIVLLAIASYFFFVRRSSGMREERESISKLEEEMKDCC